MKYLKVLVRNDIAVLELSVIFPVFLNCIVRQMHELIVQRLLHEAKNFAAQTHVSFPEQHEKKVVTLSVYVLISSYLKTKNL